MFLQSQKLSLKITMQRRSWLGNIINVDFHWNPKYNLTYFQGSRRLLCSDLYWHEPDHLETEPLRKATRDARAIFNYCDPTAQQHFAGLQSLGQDSWLRAVSKCISLFLFFFTVWLKPSKIVYSHCRQGPSTEDLCLPFWREQLSSKFILDAAS